MSDNILITVQNLIQDVVAPDVREVKAKVDSLEKRMDERFDSLEKRMDERFDGVDRRFKAMEDHFVEFEKRIIAVLLTQNPALR